MDERQRQYQQRSQQPTDERYYPERYYPPAPLTPQPSAHPLAVLWSLIGGVLLLVFLIAGILAARAQFIAGATIVIYVLVALAIVVIPGAVIYGLIRLHKSHQQADAIKGLEIKQAEALVHDREAQVWQREAEARQKEAEAAYREAQTDVLKRTINFDDRGNAAIIDSYGQVLQLRGNYQEHPNLTSLHYSYKADALKGEQMPQLPPGGELARPTIDELASCVARNSYVLPLGRSLQSREMLIAELLDAHIKIIGGTRMGKSCEAGALVDLACRTHDPQHLLLALLDLEYKTSRLFENDPHILTLKTPYKNVKMHARSPAEVADCLILLHELMLHYEKMSDAELERQPHVLIYLEEFLYWKKLLGQFVDKDTRQKALEAFSGIATRGIKYHLHLMACAQVDYADDELRDAMAQFIAANLSFSVKPSAAQAAGFVRGDLLRRNYEARIQGQFVVEMMGGADIGMAPDYDVRAKVKALTSVEADEPAEPGRVSAGVQPLLPEHSEPQAKGSRNAAETQDRNGVDPALAAKVEQVMQNPGENMADCIKRIWGATPGDNASWKNAKQEYIQVLEIIHAMARRGMQSYRDSEHGGA